MLRLESWEKRKLFRARLTSAYHMHRAVETFCAAGWTGIIPFPTGYRWDRRLISAWDFAGNLDTLTRAIKERVGGIAHRLTDRATAPGSDCLATTR